MELFFWRGCLGMCASDNPKEEGDGDYVYEFHDVNLQRASSLGKVLVA